MSYDRYSIEYYLMRDGWKARKEQVPPGELLEIWEKETYQGSGFGRESSEWHRVWGAPGFTSEESLRLRERFPFPERPRVTEDLLKNLLGGDQMT
jgi:hypothetical protein